MTETARFTTGYMDKALFDPNTVLRLAKAELADKDFDTLVGTGLSGTIVVPMLAVRMRKKFAILRKATDNSHHGRDRLIGEVGKRWIFLDDFISTGATRVRVVEKVNEIAEMAYWKFTPVHVGSYYYSYGSEVARFDACGGRNGLFDCKTYCGSLR